jgi:hypothetical protein
VLINAELYDFVMAPRLEKGYHQFATLGANVPAFINILTSMFWHLLVTWGQFATQKCSNLAPSFFDPDSYCEAGLSLKASILLSRSWDGEGKKT